MHIAIAGNIGSGKTTLTGLLAEHYHWTPQYEELEDNPYLYGFYNDMQMWAFHLQMFFLSKRFTQIMEIKRSSTVTVQDRTVFEDAHVFAANLHDMGLMTAVDYATYMSIYSLLNAMTTPPDLLIYLRASVETLLEQIKIRGREYELGIRAEYLEKLNIKYEAWIAQYPYRKIVVSVDDSNFVKYSDNLNSIIEQINNSLI
jgi:deoxyadenosine/deoxycytidine kinase